VRLGGAVTNVCVVVSAPGRNVTVENLILLPGLDGTGELFADFIRALPENIKATAVAYPADHFLPYTELIRLVQDSCPKIKPFVLLAESFSTPVAITCAAENPPNLVGLIICAGFLTNPVRHLSFLAGALGDPWVLKIPPPDFLLKRFLVGQDAPPTLLSNLRHAISSVEPSVLGRRLNEIFNCNVEAELARTKTPLMCLCPADDKLVAKSCGDRFVQIRPDVVSRSVSAPHLLLQREPRKAADIVSAFVAEL
jgi:pimeloyl-[acyl-carrier protein] methyl ester esterase